MKEMEEIKKISSFKELKVFLKKTIKKENDRFIQKLIYWTNIPVKNEEIEKQLKVYFNKEVVLTEEEKWEQLKKYQVLKN